MGHVDFKIQVCAIMFVKEREAQALIVCIVNNVDAQIFVCSS